MSCAHDQRYLGIYLPNASPIVPKDIDNLSMYSYNKVEEVRKSVLYIEDIRVIIISKLITTRSNSYLEFLSVYLCAHHSKTAE